jgi:hypothetical protein
VRTITLTVQIPEDIEQPPGSLRQIAPEVARYARERLGWWGIRHAKITVSDAAASAPHQPSTTDHRKGPRDE